MNSLPRLADCGLRVCNDFINDVLECRIIYRVCACSNCRCHCFYHCLDEPDVVKGDLCRATLVIPIGVVLGFGLLAGVYYLCIVPIGLMLRWLKKDPLFKELDVTAESYWIERTESIPVARYFKQF